MLTTSKRKYVYNKLREAISSGSFPPGSRLPNEPELAEYYLSKGVDTLLTDDFLKIAICCENFRKNK